MESLIEIGTNVAIGLGLLAAIIAFAELYLWAIGKAHDRME